MSIQRILFLIASLLLSGSAQAEEEPRVSFQKEIVPILVDKCLGCHNADTIEGEYSLATYSLLMKGGEHGKPIEEGKPDASLLSRMIHGTEEPLMPFEDEKLEEATIATIDRWISEGANFDGTAVDVPLEEMMTESGSPTINRDSSIPAPVSALAFQPDGKALAVAGYYQITFWEIPSGRFIDRWMTDVERIHEILYANDGALLIHAGGTPGKRGEVVVWDTASGKPLRTLIETGDSIFCAATRPGAHEVAAGGADRMFRIWDYDTGKELHSVENHADWILGLAYTPDGKRLITASRDRSAKVWDETTGEPILTFAQHTDPVAAVGAGPDGTIAATTGVDHTLRFWKTDGNGDQVRSVNAHSKPANALIFAPSGKRVFTAGDDHQIVAWNPADGAKMTEYNGHADVVYSLALSPDETLLASGSWDGEVRVWNVESGELVCHFIAVPALATAQNDQP